MTDCGAQLNLVVCYQQGKGVEQSAERAILIITKVFKALSGAGFGEECDLNRVAYRGWKRLP